MNAYIVESNKKIEPFGDHPRECLIGNRKLGDIQKEVLQSLGLTLKTTSSAQQVEDPKDHIVFDDSLYFTEKPLHEFIAMSRQLVRPTVCALPPPEPSPYPNSVLATQDVRVYPDRVEYGLHYIPTGGSHQESIPLLINAKQHLASAVVPEHMWGCREFRISMTDKVLVQVDHWVNLHNANIAMLATVPATLLNSKAKLLWAVLRSRSLNQWKLLHKINKIGKNCNIHPTAWIEFSTLGNNVQVGAGSVISGSQIGNDNFIDNNVTMQFSVVGSRCFIGSGATIRYSVLYPGVLTMARLINYSLCGRDTFLGDGVTLCDFRIDGRCVSVLKNGTPINTGSMIGACLGHDTYLAAGCVVGPGRAIPNGWRITPDRSRYISNWDAAGNITGYQRVSRHSSPQTVPEKMERKPPNSLIRRILRLPSVE